MPPMSFTTIKDAEPAKLNKLELSIAESVATIVHPKYTAQIALDSGKITSFKWNLPSF